MPVFDMAEVDYNFDSKTEADILLSFKAARRHHQERGAQKPRRRCIHRRDDLSRPVLRHLCKRGKILEVQDPNIEKFDRVVDAYDQAKKQLADMKRPAAASAASHGKNTRTDARPPRSQSAAGGGNTSQSVSREEVKRREMLHGKCFRCGRPDQKVCGICGKKGHSKGACSKNSANAAASLQDSPRTQQIQGLSLHNPPVDTYGAPRTSQADYAGASAFTCQHPNQPTPTVLL